MANHKECNYPITISLKISEDQKHQLEQAAEEEMTTEASIIRRFIRDGLKKR